MKYLMRKEIFRFSLIFLVLLGLLIQGVSHADGVKSNQNVASPIEKFLSTYKLGSGDIVSVSVFGEPDLSAKEVKLSDSGTIFLPTIGEITVGGFAVGEVESLVVARLKGRILVNPKVSVSINQYRPFFITGMVKTPGAYPYQPGLTVRMASSLAGGFEERAKLDDVLVIRASSSSKKPINIDLDEQIFPGDMVIVKESFF